MASQSPSGTLAGRLRSRFRRSATSARHGQAAEATAAAFDTAVGATGGGGVAGLLDESSELLHPDLDDCAELSELLLTEDPKDGDLQQPQLLKELQAQLMALAIENETLRARADREESDMVRELRRQLAAEQAMRRQAETAAPARPTGAIPRALARLRRRRHPETGPESSVAAAEPVADGVDLESLSTSSSDGEDDDDVTAAPSRGAAEPGPPPTRRAGLIDRVKSWAAGRLLDLMEDLQAGAGADRVEPSGVDEQLSARRLKANVSRFSRNSKPMLRCLAGFQAVVRWRSPSYTFMAALMYYFALSNGLLLPLLLLLCIVRLALNYLKYRLHWGVEFNFLSDYETQEEEEASEKERTVGTQVNFVVQVAKKVQNLTGKLSDNMEKFKNLITWRSPQHTRTVLNFLIVTFAVTLVLPATTCMYYTGIYLGVKLLVVDALFAKYPRLKRRFDGVAKMWRLLPTDQQLGNLEASRDVEKYILPYTEGEPGGDGSQAADKSPLASDDEHFCQVFALPNMERPLSHWRGGKRCAIICKDADRALPSSLKHGKLFLTRSFLCFERSKDRGKARKRNLVIPLAMIRWAKKTKPFAWFPGGGMSIDVQIFGIEKPIIFGAIIGRDEAFDSLTGAGKKAGLAWAGGSGGGGGSGGDGSDVQADPQLVQSVTQALRSDSDIED